MQLDIKNKATKGHWNCSVYPCLESLRKMYMCEWQPKRKCQTKRMNSIEFQWILWFLLSSLITVSITYKIMIYSNTSLSEMLSVLSSIILLQPFASHPLCPTLLAPSSLEVLRVEIASEIIVTILPMAQRRDQHSENSKDWHKVSKVSGPQRSEGKYEILWEINRIQSVSYVSICFMIAWFSFICNSRNFLPLASTPNHYGLEVSGQSLGEHASRVAVKGPGPTSLAGACCGFLRAHASVSNKIIFEK